MIETTLQALADPKRRAILESLSDRELAVGELVARVGLGQPGMSKHLRVLREAGLVSVRGDAQRRVYSLQPEPMVALDAWLAPFRERWIPALDALGRYLDTASARSER